MSLAEQWYVGCKSRELGATPVARTVLSTPLVFFRSLDGKPHALADRCAHRNAPLSKGQVVGVNLECPYHGWQYDGGGVCKVIPALCGEAEGRGRRVLSYPVIEQDGFIWVFASTESTPISEPHRFRYLNDPHYCSVVFSKRLTGSLHAVAENMLDVTHTAYLHRGLFRGGKKNQIKAVIRCSADQVEAEYMGEPRPPGWVAKILAPGSSDNVIHFDRFLLPSIAQIEYRLGKSHFFIDVALTPSSETQTEFFAVLSFSLSIPSFVVRPILYPVARWILHQDQAILKDQAHVIAQYGGSQFVSTEADILGPEILRLLNQSERGVKSAPVIPEKTISILV